MSVTLPDVAQCRSSYYADTDLPQEPGQREVRCGLPTGHEGTDHSEVVDDEETP